MKSAFLRKLTHRRIWKRLLTERLSEPLHLNILSLFVAALGRFETKVAFDLVIRQSNAFCLLEAARFARRRGYDAFTAMEFGVANGAGLLNMAVIAAEVTKATGVRIELAGFDNESGMPPPVDYRDHPDLYNTGDFPMHAPARLREKLPEGAKLIIGNVAETIPAYLATLRPECPVGYVSVDVDYYSSARECLEIFSGSPELYLPETLVYLDDVLFPQHNPWQGELLAVAEFNARHALRKIGPYNLLRASRIFKNAPWIDQVFLMHALDHEQKNRPRDRAPGVLGNPYLDLPTID